MYAGALFDKTKEHRFVLWRHWDAAKPYVTWIMLNPSTANADTDDFTTKKCLKYTRDWDYGGLTIVNLFSVVSTNPKNLRGLKRFGCTLNKPESTETIIEESLKSSLVIAAWGKYGSLLKRDQEVTNLLVSKGIKISALQLTILGQPYHPMNVKADAKPFLWK